MGGFLSSHRSGWAGFGSKVPNRGHRESRIFRRMWSKIALCLGLLVGAGCTSSTEPSDITPRRLSDALLTITDLDEGWEETQRQYFSERSNENPSIDPSQWCPEAGDLVSRLPDLAGRSGADVEMQFTGTEGGSRLMRLQAWSNSDAEEYVSLAIEAARTCDGIEWTDDSEVTVVNDVIDDREIADSSISWQTRIVPPPATQTQKYETVGRTTVARLGTVVMVLQIGDVNWTGTTEVMDEDQWWTIVEAAVNKLDGL